MSDFLVNTKLIIDMAGVNAAVAQTRALIRQLEADASPLSKGGKPITGPALTSRVEQVETAARANVAAVGASGLLSPEAFAKHSGFVEADLLRMRTVLGQQVVVAEQSLAAMKVEAEAHVAAAASPGARVLAGLTGAGAIDQAAEGVAAAQTAQAAERTLAQERELRQRERTANLRDANVTQDPWDGPGGARAERAKNAQRHANDLAVAATQAETAANLEAGRKARPPLIAPVNTPAKVPGTGGVLVDSGVTAEAAAIAAEIKLQRQEMARMAGLQARAVRAGLVAEEGIAVDELEIQVKTAERLKRATINTASGAGVEERTARAKDSQLIAAEGRRQAQLEDRGIAYTGQSRSEAKDQIAAFDAEERVRRRQINEAVTQQLRIEQAIVDLAAQELVSQRVFVGERAAAVSRGPGNVNKLVDSQVQQNALRNNVRNETAVVERAAIEDRAPEAIAALHLKSEALAATAVTRAEAAAAADTAIVRNKESLAALTAANEAAEARRLGSRTESQLKTAQEREVRATEAAARRKEREAATAGGAGGGPGLGGLGSLATFAIGAFTAGAAIKSLITNAEELQVALGRISAQFVAVGQADQFPRFRDEVLSIARDTGVAGAQVAAVGLIMRGAFTDADTAITQTRQAVEGMTATGLNATQAQNELLATVLAFGGPGKLSIRNVTDETLHLQDVFGATSKDIIAAVASISPLAAQMGLSFKETSTLIAAAVAGSGKPATQVASELQRVLPQIEKQVVFVLDLYSQANLKAKLPTIQADISAGKYGQVLLELVKDWETLTDRQKGNALASLGGSRAAGTLAAALGLSTRVVEELIDKSDHAGRTAQQLEEYHKSLAYQISISKEAFQQLGVALTDAGVVKAAGDLAGAVREIISVVTGAIDIFGKIDDGTHGWAVRIAEVVVAARALQVVLGALKLESVLAILLKIAGIGAVAPGVAAAGTGAQTAVAAAEARAAAQAGGKTAAAQVGALGGGVVAGQTLATAGGGAGIGARLAGAASSLGPQIAIVGGYLLGKGIADKKVKEIQKDRRELEAAINAKTNEQLDDLIKNHLQEVDFMARAAFGESFKSIVKRIKEDRAKAPPAKPGDVPDVPKDVTDTEANAALLTEKFDKGQASLGDYLTAKRAELASLEKAQGTEAVTKLIAKVQDDINTRVSHAAAAATDYALGQSEISGGGAAGDVAILTKALQGPGLNNADKLALSNRLIAAEKQLNAEQAAAEDDVIKRAEILRAGYSIPDEARIVATEAAVNATDEEFTAFAAAAEGSAERGAKLVHDSIVLAITQNISIIEALKRIRRQQIDDLKGMLNALAGADDAGVGAVLRGQIATLEASVPKDIPVPKTAPAAARGHATPGEQVSADKAADAKRKSDAAKKKSDADAAAREADQIRKAQHNLEKVQAEGDPVAVALVEIASAQDDLRSANTQVEKLNARAALLTAQRNLSKAQVQVADAYRGIDKAMAEATGDHVRAAELELEGILASLAAAKARGDKVGALQLEAQAISSARSVDVASLATSEKDIDFYKEMGQATLGQTIAKYRALLPLAAKNKDDYQALLLKIHALEKEGAQNLAFDVPSEIKLPTLYEARRLNQSQALGIGYQDNRSVQVQYNVMTEQDHQAALEDLLAVTSGQPRVGASPRGY